MTTRLHSVVVDSNDHLSLARWWGEALGWPVTYEDAEEAVTEPPEGEPGLALVFGPVPEPKAGKNRLHIDLASASPSEQAATVERLTAHGASPVDIGQGDVPWVVLADPEGNEFCVLDARDEYAGTGPIAAVVVDCADPGILAAFWAEATGWPVVRQDEDSASLRSPAGGPWLELLRVDEPKTVKNRWHLDVAPFAGDDQHAEVERLERLGAHRIDIGQGDVTWVVLADPEQNEFCVLSPR